MGLVLRRCARLIEETGATVLLIHHTGKDQAKGARGSSVIKAALDTEIEVVKKAGVIIMKVTKQKDGRDGEERHFELKSIVVGHDEEGDPETSCVVRHLTTPPAAVTMPRPGHLQERILRQYEGLLGFGKVSFEKLVKATCISAEHDLGPPIGRNRRPEQIKRAIIDLEKRGLLQLDRG